MAKIKTQKPGSLERVVLHRILRKWKKKQREYEAAVRPEWENGDKYASRRYEGEAIAYRWCIEDLEAAMENVKLTDAGTKTL